ncbi:hypothetical protein HWQ46_01655 [Shewanella sp. D64]|uniref:hypothetical protein n=1 Tax=unclassified Shewanella TaxID=196818 RepID=UPI0022BA147E|nr:MULTISPECIES: hypothetical protein [unclassified Shewanella]MEC4724252.1 hypothetical protein [Shewanella sp. D64]MEC4738764.1 hypothetical protein [Shewanella sp. E94]WBJ97796.1 hypothetical protein HWQ47_12200 [Shewanella sp. MTB7]
MRDFSEIEGIEEDNNNSLPTKNYQNTLADLTRQQWSDYSTRYLPMQNSLLAMASNDTLLTEQLDRNKTNLDNSFSLAKQNESMRLGRYGLDADNSTQSETNNSLLKGLTMASINNETRSAVDELQQKIVTGQGGAPKSLADIGAKGR